MRPAYAQRMARYNRWQNDNLYGVADRLSDEERRLDRSAFFKSIHATLNHLLWSDGQWMARFQKQERPTGGIKESVALFQDWDDLKSRRAAMDQRIIDFADTLPEAWFDGEVSWFSGALQRDMTRPAWVVLTHMFNHQTHHRGQVHAMLTHAGGKPHDTDFWVMPE